MKKKLILLVSYMFVCLSMNAQFDFAKKAVQNNPFSKESNYTISSSSQAANVGNSVAMVVSVGEITAEDKILTYLFDYNYDNTKLDYVGNSIVGTIAEGGTLKVSLLPGKLSVVWLRKAALTGKGAIVKLHFKVIGEGTLTPTITKAFFNTKAVTSVTDGTIAAIAKIIDSTLVQPEIAFDTLNIIDTALSIVDTTLTDTLITATVDEIISNTQDPDESVISTPVAIGVTATGGAVVALVVYSFSSVGGNVTIVKGVFSQIVKGNFSEGFSKLSDVKMGSIKGKLQSVFKMYKKGSKQNAKEVLGLAEGENQEDGSISNLNARINLNAVRVQESQNISIAALTSIEEVKKAMAENNKFLLEIASKINSIRDIADETDLLTVNTAIDFIKTNLHSEISAKNVEESSHLITGNGMTDTQSLSFPVISNQVQKLSEHSDRLAFEMNELSVKSTYAADKFLQLFEETVPNVKNTSQILQEMADASKVKANSFIENNSEAQQTNSGTKKHNFISELLQSGTDKLNELTDNLPEKVTDFISNDSEKDKQIAELQKEIADLTEKLQIQNSKNKSV